MADVSEERLGVWYKRRNTARELSMIRGGSFEVRVSSSHLGLHVSMEYIHGT